MCRRQSVTSYHTLSPLATLTHNQTITRLPHTNASREELQEDSMAATGVFPARAYVHCGRCLLVWCNISKGLWYLCGVSLGWGRARVIV